MCSWFSSLSFPFNLPLNPHSWGVPFNQPPNLQSWRLFSWTVFLNACRFSSTWSLLAYYHSILQAKANISIIKNQVRVFFYFHKNDENKKIFLFLPKQKPIDFQCVVCSPMGCQLEGKYEVRNLREWRISAC